MSGTNLQFNATVSATQINQWLRELETGTVDTARKINAALSGEVKKVLTIEYRTDENGLKRAVAVEKERLTAIDQITNAVNQRNKTERGSLLSLQQQAKEAAQTRNQIAKIKEITDSYGNSVRIINPVWEAANGKLQKIKAQLDQVAASSFWDRAKADLNLGGILSFGNQLVGLTQQLQAVSVIVGQITGSINAVINALAGLQQFRLAFDAVGAGAAGATQALGESSRIALGLGVSLSTVRQGFQQLTPVVLNSGGTIGDVSKITEALASRFAAFGISGDRARRVMNGVIQAFAKGKLQAEELTQQISEADPAFKTDLASALRVSVQELEALVKAGKITSQVLIEAIPLLSKSSLLFGKLGSSANDAVNGLAASSVTIDQVRTQFDNLNQLSLERLAKQFEPVIIAFLRLQATFVDFISNISKLESIRTIGLALASVIDASSGVISVFLSLTQSLLQVVNVIAPFLNALLQIPGVSQAIGLVILGRLIPPLNALKTTLAGLVGIQTVENLNGLGRALTNAAGGSSALGRSLAKLNSFKGFGQLLGGASKLDTLKAGANEIGRLGARSIQTKTRLDQMRASFATATKAVNTNRASLVAGGTANLALEATQARLGRNVDRLSRLYDAQQQRITGLGVAQRGLRSGLAGTAGATNAMAKAAGLGLNAFRGLGLAIGGAARFLGPLGIALSAVSVITAAYGNANKDVNKITEETKTRTQALSEAIKSLKSGVQDQIKPVTGLSLAWERFSLLTADAVDGIGSAFNGIGKSLSPAIQGTKDFVANLPPLVKGLGNVALGAGSFAILGAAIGSVVPIIGTAVGAIAGTAIGALVGLASSGDGTEVAFRRLERTLKASTTGVQAQTTGIINLAKALDASQSKIEANKAALAKLNEERAALQFTNAPQAQIDQKDAEIKQTQLQITVDTSKAVQGIGILRDALDKAKTDVSGLSNRKVAIELLLKKGQFDDGTKLSTSQVANLKKELNLVTTELGIQQAAVKGATIEVDKFAAKNGFLSEQARESVASLANVNTQIAALQKNAAQEINLFSADASPALQQIETVTAIRDAATRTSASLIRQLRQNDLQEELTQIQTASAARLAALNEERTQVRETANERIAALRELGPAEQELEARRKAALRARAAAGDLEARAQLERLNRNAQIADIERRTKEEEKKLNAEIRAEEKAAQAQALAIQQQLLTLAQEEKQTQLDAIRAVLEQRKELPGDLEKSTAATQGLLNNMLQIAGSSGKFMEATKEAADNLPTASTGAQGMQTAIANSVEPMTNTAGQGALLAESLGDAENILNRMKGKFTFKYENIAAAWTGGPVNSGQVYQVNELGQEGFLSASGKLTAINRPSYGLWRAPSSGTVIPAHIFSKMDVPTSGIRITSRPSSSVGGSNGFGQIVRAVQAAIISNRPVVSGIDELAAVQAHQARQIGKLGRAIKSFADKDMKVNVNVSRGRSYGYPYGPSLG